MSTADQTKYPYSVPTSYSLSVDAYVWLKNNGIEHRIEYQIDSTTEIDEVLHSVVHFARQQDATWFALKWS
jgi:hypothetical protein